MSQSSSSHWISTEQANSDSSRHRKKRWATHDREQRGKDALIMIVVLILAIVFVSPFLWLLSTALKSLPELAAFPIHWLPVSPQWGNFMQALTMIDFWHYAGNSLILATLYATLVTFSSAFVGFAFARLRGPGKHALFVIMLSTIMLPHILTVIPVYALFAYLHLINTYWPWVLWGLASTPAITFLFRQYFSTIPGALEDAALLDGCSYFRMFWQIFLPLSVPILVTAFIISFTWAWGDYFAPALLLNDDKTTLAVAMTNGYSDPSGNVFSNVLAAGTLFYIFPVLLIFLVAQKAFIRGIATVGLK